MLSDDKLHFKDAAGRRGSVTREWASLWPEEFRAYFWEEVAAYRERVERYYQDAADGGPEYFPWLDPTDALAIGSLSRIWLFSRSGDGEDRLKVIEAWDDPVLADRELLDAPNHEERVRSHLGIDDDYKLVWSDLTWDAAALKPATPGRMYASRIPGEWGRRVADGDHGHWAIAEAFKPLESRPMDRKQLSRLADQLDALDGSDNCSVRGLDFERFLADTFEAHGATVIRGKPQAGEQVDLIVSKPFRALVECRWRSGPVGAPEIGDLVRKLRRRPAIVAGIYVSMSGFTRTAEAEALDHADERVVVLFERGDVNQLVSGVVHLIDLYDSRVDDVVRRYPASGDEDPGSP